MDVERHLQRISDARRAANDLREMAGACKVASLRDECLGVVREAGGVLGQMEQTAMSPECNLLPETIGKAALKVHDALRVLEGKVAIANREAKSSILKSWGMQLQLSGSHKKSLKETREALHAALASMNEADPLTSDDEDGAGVDAVAAAMQRPQAGSPAELHLSWDRTLKVTGVCLAGSPVADTPSLWVGLSKKVEMYPGCSTASKQEVALPREHAITAATCDFITSFVWTGHMDGSVRLHYGQSWQAASAAPLSGVPVRSLAVDSRHFCWAGDDAGVLRVLAFDLNTRRLTTRFQDVPPQAQGLLQLAARPGTASAAAAAAAGAAAGLAPVHALLAKGPALFSAGGRWPHNVSLWNSHTYEVIEAYNMESFGPVHSFALLPWDGPVDAAVPRSPAPLLQQPGDGEPGGVALGFAAAPRATVPASVAAASSGPAAAEAAELSGWRLLSGHERGQVLLWQLRGMARGRGGALAVLAVIGEPRPGCAVRGMAVFDDLSMLVLAHASGGLTVLPVPSASNGALPQPGTPARPPGLPAGAGLHTWQPRAAKLQAHKSNIMAVSSLGELLITCSSTTLKSWSAERLKLEAQGDGLMFSRRSHRTQSISTSDALNNAIAAADGDTASSAWGAHAAAGAGRYESADRAAAAAAALAAANTSAPAHSAGAAGLPLFGTSVSLQAGQPPSSSGSRPGTSGVVPSACSAPNPLSRAAAAQRGMALDAKGTVIMQRAPPQPPSSSGISWPAAAGVFFDRAQPVPPIHAVGEHSLQPGSRAGVASSAMQGSAGSGSFAGNGSGALEPSGSLHEGIKVHHVICNSELVLKEVIGSGAEGKVYRGTWTNIDIAAKEYLAVDDADDSSAARHRSNSAAANQPSDAAMQRARDALRKEVSLLTSLNHPNLVRFCGVCLDPPLVVMEYYRHGSVYTMLEKARRQLSNRPAAQPLSKLKYVNYFSWDRRLEMLHDVAAGMMYLHKRHYVHGDLRSPNLFVGSDGRVKIGDFGFTKRLNPRSSSMHVTRITHPRWVAPELLVYNRLSSSSDVYSFGIIMYEMLTWKVPFDDCQKEQVVFSVMQGTRPQVPGEDDLPPGTTNSTCLANYIKLMNDCWHQSAEQRPAFDKIASRLKAMIRWRLVIAKTRQAANVTHKFKAAGSTHKATAAAAAAAAAAEPAAGSGSAAAVRTSSATSCAAAGAVAATAGGMAASATADVVAAGGGDDDLPLPQPQHAVAGSADAAAASIEASGSADGTGEDAQDAPSAFAVLRIAPAERPGVGGAVPAAPGTVSGSDLPGSPYSAFTLSTKDSTDGGTLSTPAGSAPVPSACATAQVSKSAESTGAAATAHPPAAAAAAAAANAPPQAGDARDALAAGTSGSLPSAFAHQAPGLASAESSTSTPAPEQQATAAARLDPIQESSETASGTVSTAGSHAVGSALGSLQPASDGRLGQHSSGHVQLQAPSSHQQRPSAPAVSGPAAAPHAAGHTLQQQQQQVGEAPTAQGVGELRRSGSGTDKVADWLSRQQELQQQQQQQQQQGLTAAHVSVGGTAALQAAASPFTSVGSPHLAAAGGQQPPQVPAALEVADDDLGPMAAVGNPAPQQEQQQAASAGSDDPNVFTAQDSPFFIPGAALSGSVDSGPAFKEQQPPAASAAAAAARGLGDLPAFLDAQYLDDSCLPLEPDAPGLKVAVTVAYDESLTLVEAAAASLASGSFSGGTLPSLEGGVGGGPGSAAAGRAAPGSSSGGGYSFTAAEASPFAHATFGPDSADSVGLSTAAAALAAQQQGPFGAPVGGLAAGGMPSPFGGLQGGGGGAQGPFGGQPLAGSPRRQGSPARAASGAGGGGTAGWLAGMGFAAPQPPVAVDGRAGSASSRASSFAPTHSGALGTAAPAAGGLVQQQQQQQQQEGGGGSLWNKPLDESCLNVRLNQVRVGSTVSADEDDLVAAAQRELEVWRTQGLGASRHTRTPSGAGGEQPAAGGGAAAGAAAGGAAAAAASSAQRPPSPASCYPPPQPIYWLGPGFVPAPNVVPAAAPALYPGYHAGFEQHQGAVSRSTSGVPLGALHPQQQQQQQAGGPPFGSNVVNPGERVRVINPPERAGMLHTQQQYGMDAAAGAGFVAAGGGTPASSAAIQGWVSAMRSSSAVGGHSEPPMPLGGAPMRAHMMAAGQQQQHHHYQQQQQHAAQHLFLGDRPAALPAAAPGGAGYTPDLAAAHAALLGGEGPLAAGGGLDRGWSRACLGSGEAPALPPDAQAGMDAQRQQQQQQLVYQQQVLQQHHVFCHQQQVHPSQPLHGQQPAHLPPHYGGMAAQQQSAQHLGVQQQRPPFM